MIDCHMSFCCIDVFIILTTYHAFSCQKCPLMCLRLAFVVVFLSFLVLIWFMIYAGFLFSLIQTLVFQCMKVVSYENSFFTVCLPPSLPLSRVMRLKYNAMPSVENVANIECIRWSRVAVFSFCGSFSGLLGHNVFFSSSF